MTKFITDIEWNGDIIDNCEYETDLFTPVIASLHRNNTFIPGIERVIFNGTFTRVFFKDGTTSSVRCSEKDTYSKDSAVAFAVLKRLFSNINEKGEADGKGFSSFLHKCVTVKAFDQAEYEANKKKELAAKGKDKKAPAKKADKPAPKKVKKAPTKKVKKSVPAKRDAKGHFVKK